MSIPSSTSGAITDGGDPLDALLVAEQSLAHRTEAAREEAVRIVRAARAEAEAAERALAETVARELAALEAAAGAALRLEVERIHAEAVRDRARYRDLADAQVNELARLVVGWLAESTPASSGDVERSVA